MLRFYSNYLMFYGLLPIIFFIRVSGFDRLPVSSFAKSTPYIYAALIYPFVNV